jgi:hypothetical protein
VPGIDRQIHFRFYPSLERSSIESSFLTHTKNFLVCRCNANNFAVRYVRNYWISIESTTTCLVQNRSNSHFYLVDRNLEATVTGKYILRLGDICPTMTLVRIGIRPCSDNSRCRTSVQIGDSCPNSDHICASHYRWSHDGLTCSQYSDPVYAYGLIVKDQSLEPHHVSQVTWAISCEPIAPWFATWKHASSRYFVIFMHNLKQAGHLSIGIYIVEPKNSETFAEPQSQQQTSWPPLFHLTLMKFRTLGQVYSPQSQEESEKIPRLGGRLRYGNGST